MAHRTSASHMRGSSRFTSLAAIALLVGFEAQPATAAPPTKPVTRAAAEAPVASDDAESSEAPEDAQQQLNAAFSTLLSGATMTGSFTIDAKGDDAPAKPPREESYEISSATHLGGELWLITSRIRYGDVDATVPVPVAVKWAGKTPVITLDEVTLPGMGTFSARVLFHGDRYAGTWQHDAVGGHMFGRVTPKAE
jgi:hypothetical protein